VQRAPKPREQLKKVFHFAEKHPNSRDNQPDNMRVDGVYMRELSLSPATQKGQALQFERQKDLLASAINEERDTDDDFEDGSASAEDSDENSDRKEEEEESEEENERDDQVFQHEDVADVTSIHAIHPSPKTSDQDLSEDEFYQNEEFHDAHEEHSGDELPANAQRGPDSSTDLHTSTSSKITSTSSPLRPGTALRLAREQGPRLHESEWRVCLTSEQLGDLGLVIAKDFTGQQVEVKALTKRSKKGHAAVTHRGAKDPSKLISVGDVLVGIGEHRTMTLTYEEVVRMLRAHKQGAAAAAAAVVAAGGGGGHPTEDSSNVLAITLRKVEDVHSRVGEESYALVNAAHYNHQQAQDRAAEKRKHGAVAVALAGRSNWLADTAGSSKIVSDSRINSRVFVFTRPQLLGFSFTGNGMVQLVEDGDLEAHELGLDVGDVLVEVGTAVGWTKITSEMTHTDVAKMLKNASRPLSIKVARTEPEAHHPGPGSSHCRRSFDFVGHCDEPLGMNVAADRNGYLHITLVQTGGQAEQLGIEIGDVIAGINGKSTSQVIARNSHCTLSFFNHIQSLERPFTLQLHKNGGVEGMRSRLARALENRRN
jgi:hypothetical protein